jgi:hypothetical protein
MLEGLEPVYLGHWADVLSDVQRRPSVERAARLVASHLLDSGHSMTFLHEWWRECLRRPAEQGLGEVVEEAAEMLSKAPSQFEILALFAKAPMSRTNQMPANWLTPEGASNWLKAQGHRTAGVRPAGGMLLKVEARDGWAAAQAAADAVEHISSRVLIGSGRPLVVADTLWIAGWASPVPFSRERQSVHIKALIRENQLYRLSRTSPVENALKSLGNMNEESAAPAVASAWAALEACLVGPVSGGTRSVAADRLAAIAACAFPRAELTTLAYQHSQCRKDDVASAISLAPTNQVRAAIAMKAVTDGMLYTERKSDDLARMRMERLIRNPKRVLADVCTYMGEAVHRLYRQRNLVLHWGRVDAVCLSASLRTIAPLLLRFAKVM